MGSVRMICLIEPQRLAANSQFKAACCAFATPRDFAVAIAIPYPGHSNVRCISQ